MQYIVIFLLPGEWYLAYYLRDSGGLQKRTQKGKRYDISYKKRSWQKRGI